MHQAVMTPFDLTAILMTLVALAGLVNVKVLHIPHGVAMLLAGLAGALLLFVARALGISIAGGMVSLVGRIDFSSTVTGYMLAFLLFAGAMQVDIVEVRRLWLPIGVLATLGVAGSILVVGAGTWLAARVLHLPLSLAWCMAFGALISPTDPVAVLATVKHGRLSSRLRVILLGEALFNDGVGIVAFTALIALATGYGNASPIQAVVAVAIQALGGLALGTVLAMLTIRAMETIDEFAVEVTMSIALAMGSYAAAQALHLSGAIAVVGAGMLFGGERGKKAVAGVTEAYVRSFWTLMDEILNALLFLLLGIELLIVPFAWGQLGLLAAAIPLVLASRVLIVLPWGTFYRARRGEPGATAILSWGGLHGALSLALALSLPAGPERSLFLAATYAVVTFSIVAQGLSFSSLTRLVATPKAPAVGN
jgi:CPA1 family monovalent cation:H+ antiporter